ncbi:hypothetical protein GCM10011491_30720 [Brucella endophytica]|uniref:Uncharacterized protein n=1 Tax=Brucella endophytica TaxID=1963359 RepID=A0A916SJA1_9HYPH|nr:hypothetical protein [Brucella endophytica]GGB00383.1 hypothetical protein GCM10011491_30720 [Brucella endophytica]
MNANLIAMSAMLAFISSAISNAQLYDLTGDGWYLVTLIITLIGAVATAAALAIPSFGRTRNPKC